MPRPGWSGGWQWSRDGEKVASIDLRAETERLGYRSPRDYILSPPVACPV
jgi:hypothetical protein